MWQQKLTMPCNQVALKCNLHLPETPLNKLNYDCYRRELSFWDEKVSDISILCHMTFSRTRPTTRLLIG